LRRGAKITATPHKRRMMFRCPDRNRSALNGPKSRCAAGFVIWYIDVPRTGPFARSGCPALLCRLSSPRLILLFLDSSHSPCIHRTASAYCTCTVDTYSILRIGVFTGVNHGERRTSPLECRVGTLMQIAPPQLSKIPLRIH